MHAISPILRRPLASGSAALRTGFTLVEMLVTVALVVVLMLAVTQIFSIASRTIGGGQALGAAVRDAQAAQTVLGQDLGAAAPDGPCLIIRSQRVAAWRNREDLLADVDLDPSTYDVDGDGTETGPAENLSTDYRNLLYNFRNHRVDSLMFFARERYTRQTGSGGTLVSNMTANEAAIVVQHLALPHTNGNFYLDGAANAAGAPNGHPVTAQKGMSPGNYKAAADAQSILDSNPQNLLASQWVLGRAALLLVDLTTPTAWSGTNSYAVGDLVIHGGKIYRATIASTNRAPDANPTYWEETTYYRRVADLTPLEPASTASDGKTLQRLRYDLADSSISAFNSILTAYAGSNANWPDRLIGNDRFQVDPTVTRPITAEVAAGQVPMFVSACTQFMVEFAGDFVTQTATGALDTTAANGGFTPDGAIDFVGATRQVRWYGLPRDTNGNGRILASEGDVVPLRDVMQSYGPNPAPGGSGWQTFPRLPFERTMPNNASPNTAVTTNYYAATVDARPEYVVAFGPIEPNVQTIINSFPAMEPILTARPKMLRITLSIDRPEAQGRLLDGQTFEYVFKVGD